MARLMVDEAGVSVWLRDRETILAALFRAGYAYRVGCRRGGCGLCKVELVDGEVSYPTPVSSTVLAPAERSAGVCLSCRAVPVTDTTIRLRAGDRLRLIAPFLAARGGGTPGKAGTD